MLLTFIVNIHGLFLRKIKMELKITKAFQKVLNEYNNRTNEIWKNKDSKFYNRSMKSWLQDNHTKMYSTHKEGKSVIAERLES